MIYFNFRLDTSKTLTIIKYEEKFVLLLNPKASRRDWIHTFINLIPEEFFIKTKEMMNNPDKPLHETVIKQSSATHFSRYVVTQTATGNSSCTSP